LLILRLADLRAQPDAARWLLRVIAVRSPRPRMVGLTGFHGPPDASGTVELGYEIEPDDRGLGYATEAAEALASWALTDGGARRVVLAISPENIASRAVARRLGFESAGSRWDATDGTALLFERRRTDGPEGAKMPSRRGIGAAARSAMQELAMTDDAEIKDIYPDRSTAETRTIGQRLRSVFGAHRVDPADPEHRCLCGYEGESYEDHLAWATLRDMKDVGYEVWPARH
jgi:hypothetical protein